MSTTKRHPHRATPEDCWGGDRAGTFGAPNARNQCGSGNLGGTVKEKAQAKATGTAGKRWARSETLRSATGWGGAVLNPKRNWGLLIPTEPTYFLSATYFLFFLFLASYFLFFSYFLRIHLLIVTSYFYLQLNLLFSYNLFSCYAILR